MAEITMPKMSDAMEEGTVIKWLKHEGDQVQKGEPIAEIETEKATLEIESFETGVIQELKTKEGETVPVGTPIAVVSADGQPAAAPSAAAQAPAAEAPPEQEKQEAVEERPPAPPPEPPRAEPPPSPPAPPAPPRVTEEEERIKASPLAQKMAKDAGLDLRDITGTGPGGRIVEADIKEHLEAEEKPTPAPPKPAERPAAPPSPAEQPAAKRQVAGEAELSRIRKTVAKRMTESKQTVPHFYVTSEVKMDEALRLRESLNEVRDKDSRISLTDFITKACALALMRVPEINASWHGEKLQYHEHANIGIAVALDDGLIAPVIPECDVKSLSEIAVKSRELIAKARSGQIHPDELAGATFTISNLGMFDVEDFVAIIVPPESAILAVASAIPRPVVVDDKVEIVKTMKMTVSADHRVTDGVGAAKFLKEVKRLLEQPYLLVQ